MMDGMKKIVVLHGWGQSRATWDNFAGSFPKGVVETIDLPGFGSEPNPSETWGVPEYAAWTRKKIEAGGWDDVILLGHSFGGRIAAHIAADRPAWLAGLVLYGAPCIYRPGFSVRARKMVAGLLRPFRSHFSDRFKPRSLRDAEASGLGEIFRGVVGFDQTERLGRIGVPTLLCWGSEDAEVPLAIAEETRRLIPNSRLVVIDRAGHNVHLENPSYFYGIIRTFVEGC